MRLIVAALVFTCLCCVIPASYGDAKSPATKTASATTPAEKPDSTEEEDTQSSEVDIAINPLVLQAEGLIDSVLQGRAESAALAEQQEGTEGEDYIALETRLFKRRLETLTNVNQLTKNVNLQREEGLNVGPYLIRLEPFLEKLSPLIQNYTEDLEKQLSEQAAATEPLSETDLQIRRKNNIQLNATYQALLNHISSLELLQLDASDERYFLVSRLKGRAEKLAGRIENGTSVKTDLEGRLEAEPEDIELQASLVATEDKLNEDTKHLSMIVSMLGAMNQERSDYQRLLLTTTGDITTDIFDRRLIADLFDQWRSDTRKTIKERGPTYMIQTGIFLGILLLFRMLAMITNRIVLRSVTAAKFNISHLLQQMIASIASRLVMILGLLMALSQVGVSLGPLLAGLGVAGFIIGFALQDTLGNFAAGLMILIYRPYDVDDLVEAASVFGTVKTMNLVSTTILTIDNQTLVVPNSKIWGDVIRNVTAQSNRRVDLVFAAGYTEDIARIESILTDILQQHHSVLKEPEPMVKLHKLNESSMDFIVRPWVQTDDYWDVYWDITRQVKTRFDLEGIRIPFPQRDIHLHPASNGPLTPDPVA